MRPKWQAQNKILCSEIWKAIDTTKRMKSLVPTSVIQLILLTSIHEHTNTRSLCMGKTLRKLLHSEHMRLIRCSLHEHEHTFSLYLTRWFSVFTSHVSLHLLRTFVCGTFGVNTIYAWWCMRAACSCSHLYIWISI